jgi:hypothetical protein
MTGGIDVGHQKDAVVGETRVAPDLDEDGSDGVALEGGPPVRTRPWPQMGNRFTGREREFLSEALDQNTLFYVWDHRELRDPGRLKRRRRSQTDATATGMREMG